jgi:hypothetical protein
MRATLTHIDRRAFIVGGVTNENEDRVSCSCGVVFMRWVTVEEAACELVAASMWGTVM